jgi:hypothetical protein
VPKASIRLNPSYLGPNALLGPSPKVLQIEQGDLGMDRLDS